MRLEGRTAVITGAASGWPRHRKAVRGGGGAHRDPRPSARPEGGRRTLAEIADAGGSARFVEGDVTRVDDIVAAVNAAADITGRLDIMVNNAAIGGDTPLLETTEEQFDHVMAVNAKGCSSAAARPSGAWSNKSLSVRCAAASSISRPSTV